jgi:hypothetical protein
LKSLRGYFLAIQQEIYNELGIAVTKLSNGHSDVALDGDEDDGGISY